MKILKLKDKDKNVFNELAFSYGTIFNSIEWANIFGEKVQLYGFYNDNDNDILIGGFILYKEKRYGISIYRNPPFTPVIGPFLKIDAQNYTTIMDTWKYALSLMAEFINNLPYSIISISLNINIIDTQPFIWEKFKVVPRYTYILDLSIPVNDIWKRMSTDRRKNIRKGLKDGLKVKQTYDYKIVKSLVLNTFSRQQNEMNEYYLDNILFKFATNNNSYAFLTLDNDNPIACSFNIYDKNTAFYLLGGYDYKNKHHGAGTMAMWEAINHAKNIGLKYFDFEGSMIPQIERYFRGFGGTLTPYYTLNKASLPLEIVLKFLKRERF